MEGLSGRPEPTTTTTTTLVHVHRTVSTYLHAPECVCIELRRNEIGQIFIAARGSDAFAEGRRRRPDFIFPKNDENLRNGIRIQHDVDV